jgi:hypothetical protein
VKRRERKEKEADEEASRRRRSNQETVLFTLLGCGAACRCFNKQVQTPSYHGFEARRKKKDGFPLGLFPDIAKRYASCIRTAVLEYMLHGDGTSRSTSVVDPRMCHSRHMRACEAVTGLWVRFTDQSAARLDGTLRQLSSGFAATMFHPRVSPSFLQQDQPVIGIIGMGAMGNMYAKLFSAAGWKRSVAFHHSRSPPYDPSQHKTHPPTRRVHICDKPEKYEQLKLRFDGEANQRVAHRVSLEIFQFSLIPNNEIAHPLLFQVCLA